MKRLITSFILMCLSFMASNTGADLIYQPASKPSSEESAKWKQAATVLLRATSQIWEAFADFEGEQKDSAAKLFSTATDNFQSASELYSSIAKYISRPRKVDLNRFRAVDPELARRLQNGLGADFPNDERAAAELASKQITALLTWIKQRHDQIYSFKVRDLQDLGMEVSKIGWIGTDVARMLQEGLEQ
jgi:Asp-tRNA(Asn)/Glu-tRNA(Gln) amidotransferase A subunit family amidase